MEHYWKKSFALRIQKPRRAIEIQLLPRYHVHGDSLQAFRGILLLKYCFLSYCSTLDPFVFVDCDRQKLCVTKEIPPGYNYDNKKYECHRWSLVLLWTSCNYSDKLLLLWINMQVYSLQSYMSARNWVLGSHFIQFDIVDTVCWNAPRFLSSIYLNVLDFHTAFSVSNNIHL